MPTQTKKRGSSAVRRGCTANRRSSQNSTPEQYKTAPEKQYKTAAQRRTITKQLHSMVGHDGSTLRHCNAVAVLCRGARRLRRRHGSYHSTTQRYNTSHYSSTICSPSVQCFNKAVHQYKQQYTEAVHFTDLDASRDAAGRAASAAAAPAVIFPSSFMICRLHTCWDIRLVTTWRGGKCVNGGEGGIRKAHKLG